MAAASSAVCASGSALRSSLGLGSLSVDSELTSEARTWAQTMKDSGGIFHSSNLAKGISANWKKLGENVGVGGTVDDLFAAFVASPKHYENLVDPAYTSVGIGVVWADGRMYTAHRFMAVFPASAPAPTPTPTNAPPPKSSASPNTAPQPNSPAVPATAAPPEELAATEPEQTTIRPIQIPGRVRLEFAEREHGGIHRHAGLHGTRIH